MRFLFFLILLIVADQSIAQVFTRKIVDRQTASPIAYVTVKILHAPGGTIASGKGEFNLLIDPPDSVLFSCVGYEQKILTGREIGTTIYLDQKIKPLKEVIVGKRKLLRTLLLGKENKNKKGDMNWGPTNKGKDEFAQKIEFPDSSLFYKIKKIYIPVKKSFCLGPLLLHIYAADPVSNYPGEELFLKPIYISKKNVRNKTASIDLSSENLYFKNCKSFFISIGWLPNAANEECVTTILLSKSSKALTYSRTLYSSSYNWFAFGSGMYKNGVHFEIRTFYSVEVDEMK